MQAFAGGAQLATIDFARNGGELTMLTKTDEEREQRYEEGVEKLNSTIQCDEFRPS